MKRSNRRIVFENSWQLLNRKSLVDIFRSLQQAVNEGHILSRQNAHLFRTLRHASSQSSRIRSLDLASQAFDIRFGSIAHAIALQIMDATQLTDQRINIHLEYDIRCLTQTIYRRIVTEQ